MVRAYMMSFLARQMLVLQDAKKFEARYPHPWLVWEPGHWNVPADITGTMETRLPSSSTPERPAKGDALCFALLSDGGFRVGRASENEIRIEDATMSREHFTLDLRPGVATVVPHAGGKGVLVREAKVLPGSKKDVPDRTPIKAGDVTLTFLRAASFAARVQDEAKRLK